jgi:hypothetical protein
MKINDPRLPSLWSKARERNLCATEIGEGLYKVTSSNPLNEPYDVNVLLMSCRCRAGQVKQPCTHLAWAIGEHSMEAWRELMAA